LFSAACRGNTIVKAVTVTSQQLGTLDCDIAAADNVPVDGVVTCTGTYTVQQEDIEAGAFLVTADATSSSLATPALGQGSVTISSNPQLTVDVLAEQCTHNLTSKSLYVRVLGTAQETGVSFATSIMPLPSPGVGCA
jgi:hypothetical protein